MPETLFAEMKRYVGWSADDEATLRALHPVVAGEFRRIADVFYERIQHHDTARAVLESGESTVGRLKITLVAWMERLFLGPWDEEYFDVRCRIGRVHVRIAMPQHYMFVAMNVVRQELNRLVDEAYLGRLVELERARAAVGKIIDLELAIMLHTYREDLLAQQEKSERLSTFGQLVGSIGHELRNPLGVIESSLYILRGRIGEDPRAKKHMDRIAEQLSVANSAIAGLLDMIRDKPLVREPVELARVVEETLESLAPAPTLTVERRGLAGLPTVDGDRTQLRQVLRNLVENAVVAAGPTGTVRIEGSRLPGAVELAVSDSGPGVDPTIRRRLFEPLVAARPGGVGLGLALVRRIVERHGGSVVYAPVEGTPGARFVVRLPVEARDA